MGVFDRVDWTYVDADTWRIMEDLRKVYGARKQKLNYYASMGVVHVPDGAVSKVMVPSTRKKEGKDVLTIYKVSGLHPWISHNKQFYAVFSLKLESTYLFCPGDQIMQVIQNGVLVDSYDPVIMLNDVEELQAYVKDELQAVEAFDEETILK
jgi:hypothetical protein